ncbi:hypothetical protein [Streptomyces sp. NPDC048106]|uniref:hypothetical protein n=1 Tax=Streptomyces sp. NPDC048106 TaxID=3155750 RepID=UPI003453D339
MAHGLVHHGASVSRRRASSTRLGGPGAAATAEPAQRTRSRAGSRPLAAEGERLS